MAASGNKILARASTALTLSQRLCKKLYGDYCSSRVLNLAYGAALAKSYTAPSTRLPLVLTTTSLPARQLVMSSSSADDDLHCNLPTDLPEEGPPCRPNRRPSTVNDEARLIGMLKELFSYRNSNVGGWIVENKAKTIVQFYKCFLKPHKEGFLEVLATEFSVDQDQLNRAIKQFSEFPPGSALSLKAEEQLKTVLTPQYAWLFKVIGRLEAGVKFLVDLRTDILAMLSSLDPANPLYVRIQKLNSTLKDLLSLWFSVGFLNLERVTWKSPCEMLQKISEYEAVHPMRSWTDLKRRVGLYRRCFVYTHSAMPGEPLVVLHTALTPEISTSTKGLIASTQRMSVDSSSSDDSLLANEDYEDPNLINAVIFYSISSTQKGLQGIELGNYLIKRVVTEIQAEFPRVTQFSTLSPIPTFKTWLMEKIKSAEKDKLDTPALPLDKWTALAELAGGWDSLRRSLHNNTWINDERLTEALEKPMLATCAHYLYKEKRRGLAFDLVANFHLRNGATMWRLNWMADMSPRGMTNSCGLMINYRYFLEETEANSKNYLENKIINASEQIIKLAGEKMTSKM